MYISEEMNSLLGVGGARPVLDYLLGYPELEAFKRRL
jgi:hypothetical protein